MSQIGVYQGIKWIRHRICDVMVVNLKARWYFIYGEDGKPTGDHFRTIRDMEQHIDCMKRVRHPQDKAL